MNTEEIMTIIDNYASLTAMLATLEDENKRTALEQEKDDKRELIRLLIKIAQKDTVIDELREAIKLITR